MPIFLNFLGIGGDHTQDALNDSFLKIDTDFLKLSTAPTTDAFLKIESGHKIKIAFDVIDDAFLKLSEGFHKIDSVAIELDSFAAMVRTAVALPIDTATEPTRPGTDRPDM